MAGSKKGGRHAPEVPNRVHLIQHHLLAVLRHARVEVLKRHLARADEHKVSQEHDYGEHRE